jgi:hypothetical protein
MNFEANVPTPVHYLSDDKRSRVFNGFSISEKTKEPAGPTECSYLSLQLESANKRT